MSNSLSRPLDIVDRTQDHHVRTWPGRVDLRCLHGSSQDWDNHTVIVPAVYGEWHGRPPPSWLYKQYPVYLYQRVNISRPCACANRGYESGVYFHFIAQHYEQLPAFVAFIQADWIFQSKDHGGRPFEFWQPQCMQRSESEVPWMDYMPLGGRHSIWPPRCVIRSTAWYGHVVGMQHLPLIEACAREVLRILDVPVVVRPYNRSQLLNLTFYTNMNFLVSRQRIRSYAHHAWRALAHRFVEEGVCLPPAAGGGVVGATADSGVPVSAMGSGSNTILDSRSFAKFTLGSTTEVLQQTIFGYEPLEHGPAPKVPSGRQCSSHAASWCTPY